MLCPFRIELLRPISAETTHLVRWDRIEQPIFAFVRSYFALAGLRRLVDDWLVDSPRKRSVERATCAPRNDCTRHAQNESHVCYIRSSQGALKWPFWLMPADEAGEHAGSNRRVYRNPINKALGPLRGAPISRISTTKPHGTYLQEMHVALGNCANCQDRDDHHGRRDCGALFVVLKKARIIVPAGVLLNLSLRSCEAWAIGNRKENFPAGISKQWIRRPRSLMRDLYFQVAPVLDSL